jgi:NhaA family Na+:H+ antiporter
MRGARASLRAVAEFMKAEASGGIVLMAAAVAALVIANSPWAPHYFHTLEAEFFGLSLHDWINDALMALFFLVIGLEIKREMLVGELSSWGARLLPGAAALGGMAAPALVFLAFDHPDPQLLRGWAIPTATDIAFALGVLALLGRRAPSSLKLFLTALAIIDDMGAVAIIALFYSGGLSLPMLGGAALCLAVLYGLNRAGVTRLWPYLVLGLALWVFVFHSGVHATLAGLSLAFTIPLRIKGGGESPLARLEHKLLPVSAFFVVPVFGFANAGVAFGNLSLASLTHPVTLGIVTGLFIGKQVGVFGTVFTLVKAGLVPMPAAARWSQIYGVSVLTGIGFTMSLFIGLLAYPAAPALQDLLKVGVLSGSLISGIAGALILLAVNRRSVGSPSVGSSSVGSSGN